MNMEILEAGLLTALIFAAALLYASVGHAGASGYLAVMALFGLAPETMKPTVLLMNIFVSMIGTIKFYRAGYFSRALFWPLILASAPCAFIGGLLTLPSSAYLAIVGLMLLFASTRILRQNDKPAESTETVPPLRSLILLGSFIGFLSGLTGVGGGIFLSPLLVLLYALPLRQVSGVAAPFIMVNSYAGLMGVLIAGPANFPPDLSWWIIAAASGGFLGAELGSRRMSHPAIRYALALVLLIAGAKMLTSASLD